MKSKKLEKTTSRLIGIVFLISIVASLFYYIAFSKTVFIAKRDFVSFLTGASMLKAGERSNFYNLETQHNFQQKIIWPYVRKGVLPFSYPPSFALLFLPLTFFPLGVSYKIFAVFNFGLLAVLTYLLKKNFSNIGKYKLWFLFPFVFLPNIVAVILGQLSIALSIIILLLYKYLKEKRVFLAGILSSLLLLKPQYAIAIPFFILFASDKKRFISGLLVMSLILLILSLVLVGTEAILSYPSFLLSNDNVFLEVRPQRMLAISSGLFYNLPWEIGYKHSLYLNALFYFLVYLLFYKRYKLIDFNFAFISAIIISLLFAVHVLEHDLSVLLVPVFILISYSIQKPKMQKPAIFLAALIFFLPVITLIISPFVATLTALAIATLFLFEGKSLGRIWKIKK